MGREIVVRMTDGLPDGEEYVVTVGYDDSAAGAQYGRITLMTQDDIGHCNFTNVETLKIVNALLDMLTYARDQELED